MLKYILVLCLSLFACLPLHAPTMSKTLIHEGNATAALVYYTDTDTLQESHIKIVCSMVFVAEHKLLTSYHCIQALQKLQQKEEDEREQKSIASAANCDELKEVFGICSITAIEHRSVPFTNLKVHYSVWNEETNISQEPTAWHLAEVKKLDEAHDLALLTTFAGTPPHAIAELAKYTPAVGEPITVVGHPAGMAWTFLPGTVSGYRDIVPGAADLQGPFLQIASPAWHGNSGGGAFNSDGELIGICDFLAGAPGEVFFTHLSNIKQFLK